VETDSTKRIAIFGASGMLGKSLVSLCEERKIPHIRGAFSHPDERTYAKVDIRNIDSIEFFIETWKPDVLLNSSAYTKVDDAEKEYGSAIEINGTGVRNLAYVAKAHGLYLVHVSTDYVFGGLNHLSRPLTPFQENESCSPVGMYGYSKYLGEEFIRAIYPEKSLIVRTSWLHGKGGKNFIDTIARLAKEKETLSVVNDQTGSLTWTPWLSEVLLSLIEKGTTGVLHATAQDEGSWYDVAKYIVEKTGANCHIAPQSTEASGRPAPRPSYSKLGIDALATILGEAPPLWRKFIDLHLADTEPYPG
jgi:dTDP-4-dehydrorhamnose reductase